MWLVSVTGQVHGFWWGNLRERDHLEDRDVEGRAILNGYSRNKMGHGLD